MLQPRRIDPHTYPQSRNPPAQHEVAWILNAKLRFPMPQDSGYKTDRFCSRQSQKADTEKKSKPPVI